VAANITYGAIFKLQSDAGDLRKIKLDIEAQLTSAQKTVAASFNQMQASINNSAKTAATSLPVAWSKVHSQVGQVINNLRRMEQFPSTANAKNIYAQYYRLEGVIARINSNMTQLVQKEAMAAAQAKVGNKAWAAMSDAQKAAEAIPLQPGIAQDMRDFAASLDVEKDALKAAYVAIRDYEISLAELNPQIQRQTLEVNNATNAYRNHEKQSRGTWLVMSKAGGVLQGVNMSLAVATGNIQGMAMSMMFASTKTLGIMLAVTALLSPIFLAIRAAKALGKAVIDLALELGKTLINALVAVGKKLAETFTDFIVSSVRDSKERVLELATSLEMLGSAASGLATAEGAASRFGRTTDDVATAIITLRKNQIPLNKGLEATAAIAARNNITMEAAAQALASGIGLTSEGTKSLREYGIVMDNVEKGTSRAAVMQEVLNETIAQLGATSTEYLSTPKAMITGFTSALSEIKAGVGKPIWENLLAPLAGVITPQLKPIREALSNLFGNIDYGKLVAGISGITGKLSTELVSWIDNIIGKLPAITTVIEDIAAGMESWATSTDWGQILADAQVVIGKISALVVGIGSAFAVAARSMVSNWGVVQEAMREVTTEKKTSFAEQAADYAALITKSSTEFYLKVTGAAEVIQGIIQAISSIAVTSATLIVTSTKAPLYAILAVVDSVVKLAQIADELLNKAFTLLGMHPTGGIDWDSVNVSIQGAYESLGTWDSVVNDIKKSWSGVVTGINRVRAGVDRVKTAEDGAARSAQEVGTITYESTSAATAAIDEYIAKITDPALTAQPHSVFGNADEESAYYVKKYTEAGEEINSVWDYVSEGAAESNSKVKQELNSLISSWKDLVSSQLDFTIDFDYTDWMDNMTTAYDKVGQGADAAAKGIGHTPTWDEKFRQVVDIVNRGGESPWAKVFVPPPEVMQLGDDAVKAWAANLAREFQLGMHPEMIDWGAFITNLQEQIQSKANWEGIKETAMQMAEAQGLGITEAEVQTALGITLSPEAAKSLQMFSVIRDGFQAQADEAGLGRIVLYSLITDVTNNEDGFKAGGGSIGDYIKIGLLDYIDSASEEVQLEILKRWVAVYTPPNENDDEDEE